MRKNLLRRYKEVVKCKLVIMASPDEICKKADGKRKGTLFGFGTDYDGANELYMKAAGQYKLQKDYLRAGETYMKAGECAGKLKNQFQVAEAYQQAAMMFQKACSPQFEATLQLAVQALVDNNRLNTAAGMVMKAADEQRQAGQPDKALPLYQKAENYYHADGMEAMVQKAKVAQADIYTELLSFDKAAAMYEAIGKNMLQGPLKYQSYTFQFKALLCRFAAGDYSSNRAMTIDALSEDVDTAVSINPYLQGIREEEVLRDLLIALRDEDMEKFDEVVKKLQMLKMLDEWTTGVMLHIKEKINSIL